MLKEELQAALSHPGERGAVTFLKQHPEIVVWGFCRTGGHSKYVLAEFPFGSRYRVDLVIPFSYSGTWEVNFVEFEPVDDPVVTREGRPSARLNAAISQVSDWREFVDRNRGLIQQDLSDWCMKHDLLGWHENDEPPSNFTSDYLKDPEIYICFSSHIIIGRRDNVSREQRRKMNQFRAGGYIEIGTYDRFVDIAGNYDRHNANSQEAIHLPSTLDDE